MDLNRRTFLQSTLLATLSTQIGPWLSAGTEARTILKPRRLARGATVGLVSPASATWVSEEIAIIEETLATLGLKAKLAGTQRLGHVASSLLHAGRTTS